MNKKIELIRLELDGAIITVKATVHNAVTCPSKTNLRNVRHAIRKANRALNQLSTAENRATHEAKKEASAS